MKKLLQISKLPIAITLSRKSKCKTYFIKCILTVSVVTVGAI